MKKIKPKQADFSIDYKNELLPDLFFKKETECNFSSSEQLKYYQLEDLLRYSEQVFQTLLIACEQLKNPRLIQALQNKADTGVRIYLLLGNEPLNQNAIDALSGRCLIRTGVPQKGALFLVDHQTSQQKGLLLMDSQTLNEDSFKSYAIELEPQQINDSFRSFSHLFWEHATKEYKTQNTAKPTQKHPDGPVLTNHSHHLLGNLKNTLFDVRASLQEGSCITNEMNKGDNLLLLKTDSPYISRLASQNTALTDMPIPSLLLAENENWLLPDDHHFDRVNWCLKLSKNQGEKIKRDFKLAMETAAWQFQAETTLGKLDNEHPVRFVHEPHQIRSIKVNRKIKLEDIQTDDIDTFLFKNPQSLTKHLTNWKPDLLAYQIDYTLCIHPPYRPINAILDPLYKRWEQTEAEWQSSLDSLQSQQKKIDEKQANILDNLKYWIKNFLLSQEHSIKQLNQEIERLKNASVTKATPSEREKMKQELLHLQQKVATRAHDTSIKVDEAKQEEAWKEKRSSLDKDHKIQTDLVKAKKRIFEEHQNEKSNKIKDSENSFNDKWKKVVANLKEKSLSKMQGQTPETLSAMNIKEAEKWKASIGNKEWTMHYSHFEQVIADHYLAQKIDRDIDEAKRALTQSQSQLKQAEEKLNAHGDRCIYHPKKSSNELDKQLRIKEEKGNSFPSFTWPEEDLPHEASRLFYANKNRFLMFSDLDQLDQVREDAVRLKASIVCEEEKENA